jgi:hypothetical protein
MVSMTPVNGTGNLFPSTGNNILIYLVCTGVTASALGVTGQMATQLPQPVHRSSSILTPLPNPRAIAS